MIEALFNAKSIVVLGGSNNLSKPGGAILQNILKGNYSGDIYVINPNTNEVQGCKTLSSIEKLLVQIDLAILAIPAANCFDACNHLLNYCQTKAIIILSAGFSETSIEGRKIEVEIIDLINSHGATLIGPNCIGIKNRSISAIFTKPNFTSNSKGIDLITSSGATAVFFIEQGLKRGLTINSLMSVGNGNQTGIEEILEYLDETYDAEKSSHVKVLYLEAIKNPTKFLTHTKSLIQKGCKIAAIKSGISEAGGKAAQSHTGALLSNNDAVNALFSKAGIYRCNGREQLLNIANILLNPQLKGKRIAIITHAGGPAVMLSDTLSMGGFEIPSPNPTNASVLQKKLFQGSSVNNPFDFLATGTALQLDEIITFCKNDKNNYDAIVTILGSPGLEPITEALNVIKKHQKENKNPIYTILPSIINSESEIMEFIKDGVPIFVDEVNFGEALCAVYSRQFTKSSESPIKKELQNIKSQDTITLDWVDIFEIFKKYNIPSAQQWILNSATDLDSIVENLTFPLVAKVNGINHKSDVGGVITNIANHFELQNAFHRLINIPNANGVIVQHMLKGVELFIGAKYEPNYGHLISVGLGGIYIEVFKDLATELCPITFQEAKKMIASLKCAEIFDGLRGNNPISKDDLAQITVAVSEILRSNPEILELDINPLIATKNGIFAVDGRITKQDASYEL